MTHREEQRQLPRGFKEGAMEQCRPRSSLFEPAMYRISILGSLDKNLSDYYGSMTIEHTNDPHYGSMTILTGRLPDQSALIGVLNSLHDIGCPILLVEYREAT
jgi:hypothetical protein